MKRVFFLLFLILFCSVAFSASLPVKQSIFDDQQVNVFFNQNGEPTEYGKKAISEINSSTSKADATAMKLLLNERINFSVKTISGSTKNFGIALVEGKITELKAKPIAKSNFDITTDEATLLKIAESKNASKEAALAIKNNKIIVKANGFISQIKLMFFKMSVNAFLSQPGG